MPLIIIEDEIVNTDLIYRITKPFSEIRGPLSDEENDCLYNDYGFDIYFVGGERIRIIKRVAIKRPVKEAYAEGLRQSRIALCNSIIEEINKLMKGSSITKFEI